MICPPPPPRQYPITLVTAYFDLGGKTQYQHLSNLYPGWIRNFLPHVRWPLVVFCDEQSLGMLKEARGDKPAVWHVTSLEEFSVHKYMNHLKARRRPYRIPHPELALVWHEKHHFLLQAMSENPFGSEMFFWCDIGLFRFRPKSRLKQVGRHIQLSEDVEWPNLRICRMLPQDRVLLVPDAGSRIGSVQIAGGFFGGALKPTRRWCDAYRQFLDKAWQDGKVPYIDQVAMCLLYMRQPEIAYLLSSGIAWRRRGRFLYRLLTGRPVGKPYDGSNAGWYLLSGERFPWKYCLKCLLPGPGR